MGRDSRATSFTRRTESASASPSATGCSPTTKAGKSSVLPGKGTTNATGRLTGTIEGKALAGVTIKIGNQSTITDIDGRFKLYHVPRGTLPASLSGEGIYPCSLRMNTAKLGSIKVNTIEKSSHFNLDFYRELARGNHPQEREIHPLYRWTRSKAPTFYIDTNTSLIEGKIHSKTLRLSFYRY